MLHFTLYFCFYPQPADIIVSIHPNPFKFGIQLIRFIINLFLCKCRGLYLFQNFPDTHTHILPNLQSDITSLEEKVQIVASFSQCSINFNLTKWTFLWSFCNNWTKQLWDANLNNLSSQMISKLKNTHRYFVCTTGKYIKLMNFGY